MLVAENEPSNKDWYKCFIVYLFFCLGSSFAAQVWALGRFAARFRLAPADARAAYRAGARVLVPRLAESSQAAANLFWANAVLLRGRDDAAARARFLRPEPTSGKPAEPQEVVNVLWAVARQIWAEGDGWAQRAGAAYAAAPAGAQTAQGLANAVWALAELRAVHDDLFRASFRVRDPLSDLLVRSAGWLWRTRPAGKAPAPRLRRCLRRVSASRP